MPRASGPESTQARTATLAFRLLFAAITVSRHIPKHCSAVGRCYAFGSAVSRRGGWLGSQVPWRRSRVSRVSSSGAIGWKSWHIRPSAPVRCGKVALLAHFCDPSALFAWLVYRGIALGDLHPSFNNPRMLIYGSWFHPARIKSFRSRRLSALASSLARDYNLHRYPTIDLAVDLTLGGVFLGLFAFAWRTMRPAIASMR